MEVILMAVSYYPLILAVCDNYTLLFKILCWHYLTRILSSINGGRGVFRIKYLVQKYKRKLLIKIYFCKIIINLHFILLQLDIFKQCARILFIVYGEIEPLELNLKSQYPFNALPLICLLLSDFMERKSKVEILANQDFEHKPRNALHRILAL